ncbi:MAG: hypothetical protein ACTHKF_08765 [Candidatus Nitrosocosmicus sp.]
MISKSSIQNLLTSVHFSATVLTETAVTSIVQVVIGLTLTKTDDFCFPFQAVDNLGLYSPGTIIPHFFYIWIMYPQRI